MKKLDGFLRTLFWVAPGMLLGVALAEYLDYKAHPGLYAMWSAPWYVDLLRPAIVCLAIMAASWGTHRLIRRWL